MIVLNCPGMITVILPFHIHDTFPFLSKAGLPQTLTFEDAADHFPVTIGIHGIGVRTPKAATVAAATIGFAKDLHNKNGKIFKKGIESDTFATDK
jgi:hypothetical protein